MRSFILTAAFTLGATLAHAQTTGEHPCAELEASVRRANELRRQGDDADAYTLLTALRERCHEPRLLAQIGLASHALHRWLDAWRNLRAALMSPDDPWVTTWRAVLTQLRDEARGHLAEIVPTTYHSGAVLEVDGQRVGVLPLDEPYVVTAGSHRVRVSLPGHITMEDPVDLSEGGRYENHVVLLSEWEPDTASAPAVTRSPTPHPRAEATVTPRATPTSRYVGFGLLGAGALSLAAGFAVAYGANERSESLGAATTTTGGEYGAFARYAAPFGQGASTAFICGSAQRGARGGGDESATASLCATHAMERDLALGLQIGGAMLAGAGLITLLVSYAAGHEAPPVRATAWVAPGVLGASLAGTF
jgi:hypothetical protein